MKGIILAATTGTSLYPVTKSISKQLIPVYDKPMIYYPLATLLLAGLKDILIITTPGAQDQFTRLLGDGSQWGINLVYAVQPSPGGVAQAFLIGKDFIGCDSVALILGDNILYGDGLPHTLQKIASEDGATIFAYPVKDPGRYGVVTINKFGEVTGIEEKPGKPKSNYAVTGLYFYDNSVVDIAAQIKPSELGGLEITSVNQEYLARGALRVKLLSRGFAWLDTATHASLVDAANYVKILEDRQGLKIACLEEIAYRMGYIDAGQVAALAAPLLKNGYGQYLMDILREVDH